MPDRKNEAPEVYPYLAETVKVGSIVAVKYDEDRTRSVFPNNVGKFKMGEYYGPVTSIVEDHVTVRLKYAGGKEEEIEYDATLGWDLTYGLCIKRIGSNAPAPVAAPKPTTQGGETEAFDDEDVEYR